jgi:hypothetical protein
LVSLIVYKPRYFSIAAGVGHTRNVTVFTLCSGSFGFTNPERGLRSGLRDYHSVRVQNQPDRTGGSGVGDVTANGLIPFNHVCMGMTETVTVAGTEYDEIRSHPGDPGF